MNQKIEALSVTLSINKGCSTTYSPGERILISCSATADCVAELHLTYPDRSSKTLVSNQVLRQGKSLVLERKVPSTSGTYTLTLYGKTPFGTTQGYCSFTCESVGSLLVESNIDADVYIDTVYYGSSPAHIENIPVGTHEIRVTKPGHHDWTSEIIVEEGLKTTVHAVLTKVHKNRERPSETGCVYIRSEPSGAEVYLDGALKGVTPLLMENISVGVHNVKVTKQEFHDFDQVVNVTPKGSTFISATLCRGHGSIQVITLISGAKVYLDDEYEGNAPLTIYNVPEGDHSLALVKWGYEIWSSPVKVKVDEPVEVYPGVSLLWIWYILAALGLPFYKLRDFLQNLRKKHELPPYVPEFSSSNVVVTSEGLHEPEEAVSLCPFCNQELHVRSNTILECSYCIKEGFSCQFHESCWMKWLEQTHGQRKCILYPAFVYIPVQKIRFVKDVGTRP